MSEERLKAEEIDKHALQERLRAVLKELEDARRAMMEGRGQEAELKRQMEERLEREKEKRIEHTKDMAIRRIAQRDLARGWAAWAEPYLEAKRRMRHLQAPPRG